VGIAHYGVLTAAPSINYHITKLGRRSGKSLRCKIFPSRIVSTESAFLVKLVQWDHLSLRRPEVGDGALLN